MNVNYAKRVLCFDAVLDLAVPRLLFNDEDPKIGRDVLGNVYPERPSPILSPAAPHKMKIIRVVGFFHRAKPDITSDVNAGVFCLLFSTTGKSMNSAFHLRG